VAPLAERANMVYMGTSVVGGRCRAVVVETGMNTELGQIASDLQEIEDEQTPFQKRMDELGRKIGLGVVVICLIVALVGFYIGEASLLEMLLIAIALGVAAIPEGLPAVITLSLALGTKAMLKKDALVRRLPVAEALGSVDVICSDKTGTMTENVMTVTKIFFDGMIYGVSGTGREISGKFSCSGKEVDSKELHPILEAGFLNNNSKFTGTLEKPEFLGDPTEIALRISAMKAGISEEKHAENRRVDEIAFSSDRKMMTTVHDHSGRRIAYMKGAPEVVLGLCNRVFEKGRVVALTEGRKSDILKVNDAFALNALRVIGFAYKTLDEGGKVESDLVFVGLQAMIDPPRPEVRKAIEDCSNAGIRVVMITGDNKHTAEAVALEIGIKSKAVEGVEIEYMTDDKLQKVVEGVSIFARVSPKHKLRILSALKRNGHIVAMTGDGVNDAPALKGSDVGISMGLRGTDVAKGASDIILLDDNFATIRDAIEEGMRIFDNVRKFVKYLLSCNLSEVAVVFIAGLPFIAGKPLIPLTAVMLLWVNIVTDGLPALALGVDPAAPGILRRKPRPQSEGVVNRQMASWIVFVGFAISVILMGLFYLSEPMVNLQRAQTITFTALVLLELTVIVVLKHSERMGLFSNRYLLAAVASSFILQLAVLYTPLNVYFKVTPLSLEDWKLIVSGILIFGIAAVIYHRIFERE
ncbi:MAG: cation-translocating P-type ATPase, partial [Candidatus Altiarchaeota archaeon]|nr:cation-translocating P-type ATPase [Candidatus Altiarchaeota archaeon]